MEKYIIDNSWLTIEKLDEIISSKCEVTLSENTIKGVESCRAYLDEKVKTHDQLIYGVNTGFGSLCDTAISFEDLEKLQTNLVLSHSC